MIVTEVPTELEMPFNVNYLLNTNSTPSQEQQKDLQDFILQLDEAILNTDEDISGINEQILALQAKILVLQTRRTRLVQQRRCYSSLLSPVRCLPVEIFGKIFVYATRDRPRHALNISAVCQLWRDAAISTPILWSTLQLGHHTTRRNMDNHISSWIERARSYPLSLVIRKQEGFLDPVYSVFSLITKHQWKSITLDGVESILLILKELEISNLEMLESFSPAPRFRTELPDALRHAPKLKTLFLDVNYIDKIVEFDSLLPFPWKQLTSLTLTFPRYLDSHRHDIILDVLQACVNLEEFIKEGGLGEGHPFGLYGSITLSYLRKLHTQVKNRYLLSLKTPSIQDFAIETTYIDSAGVDYIEKNGSSMLKLSYVSSSWKHESGFVNCFPYLRSLVDLKIYDDNEQDDGSMCEILSSLVVNPEMDIPLPRLETLEVICHSTEDNQRIFMKVVNSRWWSDEEENARRKQKRQRSFSRIKRSVLTNVRTELSMFFRDDADVLRAQGMDIEYLAPFVGMDEDDFYKSIPLYKGSVKRTGRSGWC